MIKSWQFFSLIKFKNSFEKEKSKIFKDKSTKFTKRQIFWYGSVPLIIFLILNFGLAVALDAGFWRWNLIRNMQWICLLIDFEVWHISQFLNCTAHKLAEFASQIHQFVIWLEDFPAFILDAF